MLYFLCFAFGCQILPGYASDLEKENLCGFVFKSKSPSSGMERVRLYDRNGVPNKNGVGLFARSVPAERFVELTSFFKQIAEADATVVTIKAGD